MRHELNHKIPTIHPRCKAGMAFAPIVSASRATDKSIRHSQRKFVKLALDLHHHLEQFTIIKVSG
jgi:hypothetical protein